MDLKEGMYVRTKGRNNFPGGIAKIQQIIEAPNHNTRYLYLDKMIDYGSVIDEESITKASFNIRDLVEAGDYINGYLVLYIDEDRIQVDSAGWVQSSSTNGNITTTKIEDFDEQILTILTKELVEYFTYSIKEYEKRRIPLYALSNIYKCTKVRRKEK